MGKTLIVAVAVAVLWRVGSWGPHAARPASMQRSALTRAPCLALYALGSRAPTPTGSRPARCQFATG
eukprot:CAMPEP_0171096096 /NCGR_PEP_ID=MMETSP0766_2-20121228/43558_1 /TAXON_ID=439317 /ORGANISM="Gambierdiscus australes, Strain CAWD 149" /LENGTH=66 /DNA_ID=CAMNT_0011555003 /DNA_START=118 /DNA_END=314 /DNA_ORIENTATION=-